jgi:hypothetical protein
MNIFEKVDRCHEAISAVRPFKSRMLFRTAINSLLFLQCSEWNIMILFANSRIKESLNLFVISLPSGCMKRRRRSCGYCTFHFLI